MPHKPRIALALGYTRQVGKDTLAERLAELDPHFVRYSFGDEVRRELAAPLKFWYGIDVWRMTLDEKEFTRPYLIAHGMARRTQDPDYWVKQTLRRVHEDLSRNDEICPVITDARFANEVRILREVLGAKIVHLTREGAPPPTDEEKKHYPGLIPLSDLHLHWGGNTLLEQRERAIGLIERCRPVI